MSQLVYVCSIDIKDGWYDVIHVYTTRATAEAYKAWQAEHNGDNVLIAEVPLSEGWAPPETHAC